MKKKGFTLIELIAVLVILAVIALIVTPLVLNVIKSAKDSANKRSVDAYGKAIELAVANYLLDTGDFPTDISDLTIEYSGKEVVCNVATLNTDSSVYLSECKVGSSDVLDSTTEDGYYHYGKSTSSSEDLYDYRIGDTVNYKGINFYVIQNSASSSDSVTLLKADSLKKNEVDLSGTEIESNVMNDTNRYSKDYIYMRYLYRDTCNSTDNILEGCTTDYSQSSIKQVVDAWAADQLDSSDLKEDSTGYSVRLITFEELITNLGYSHADKGNTFYGANKEYTPEWVYNSNYSYWTMSQYEDSAFSVWSVTRDGNLGSGIVDGNSVVRPVITLKKSAI